MRKNQLVIALGAVWSLSGSLPAHAAATAGAPTASTGTGTHLGTSLTGSVTVGSTPVQWERSLSAGGISLGPIAASSLTAGTGTTYTGSLTIPGGDITTGEHTIIGIKTSAAYSNAAYTTGSNIRVDLVDHTGTNATVVTGTNANHARGGTTAQYTLPIMDGTTRIGWATLPLRIGMIQTWAVDATPGVVSARHCLSGSIVRGILAWPTTGTSAPTHGFADSARMAGGRTEVQARQAVQAVSTSNTATTITALTTTAPCDTVTGDGASTVDMYVLIRGGSTNVASLTFDAAQTTAKNFTIPVNIQITHT